MQQPTPQALSAMPPAFRTPKRLTITLPYGVYQALMALSDDEGRSMSNLAAFFLEQQCRQLGERKPTIH
jgi:hypothetical protein